MGRRQSIGFWARLSISGGLFRTILVAFLDEWNEAPLDFVSMSFMIFLLET